MKDRRDYLAAAKGAKLGHDRCRSPWVLYKRKDCCANWHSLSRVWLGMAALMINVARGLGMKERS